MIGLITFVVISMAHAKINENTQSGIFFTELGETSLINGHWKICYYYNMTEYHDEIYDFKVTLKEVEKLCESLLEYNCRTIVKFFKSEYRKMQADVEKLITDRKISKRSAPLKFLGRVNHYLTGVVDEDTAVQYENRINELAMSINERQTLAANQTTFIRKTIALTQNATNSMKEDLTRMHKLFREVMLGLNRNMEQNFRENRMNSIMQIGTLIIMEHKELTEKIIGANPSELIEFETISGDLRHIEESLQYRYRLPLSIGTRGDVHKILEISHSRMRISNVTMLLELIIPLVENKKYSIFKSTPIPVLHDGAMFGIKSERKNLIVNIDSKEYTEISEDELNQCIQAGNRKFVCETSAPTIVSDFNVCEADILFGDGNEFPNTCTLVKIRNTTFVSDAHFREFT